MVTANQRPKYLVIAGPTASGKSGLAIKMAKHFKGEIISADSLTAYKQMNIGTAKPTFTERAGVKHWGFDLIGPGQRFTAADFQEYAEGKIADIRDRGNLPIVVGGTGLYIDALVYDFSFQGPADTELRAKLEKLTVPQLQKLITDKGYMLPRNAKNPRHLIRTLERQGRPVEPSALTPGDVLLVGIMPSPEILRQRIGDRVEQMFKIGLVAETKDLLKLYGRDSLLAKAKVAYGPVIDYIEGSLNVEQAKKNLEIAHWQYARRQRTWLRRHNDIKWFNDAASAYEFISDQLS